MEWAESRALGYLENNRGRKYPAWRHPAVRTVLCSGVAAGLRREHHGPNHPLFMPAQELRRLLSRLRDALEDGGTWRSST